MPKSRYVKQHSIPDILTTYLDSRDVTLWISSEDIDLDALNAICSLPWHHVASEVSSTGFLDLMRSQEDLDDPMVRRRGLRHIVVDNPAELSLPPRSLPIFLMNGDPTKPTTKFASRARRTEMLVNIARSSVQALVVLGAPSSEIVDDLVDLWGEGFRPTVYVVSDVTQAASLLDTLGDQPAPLSHSLVTLSPDEFSRSLADRYCALHQGAQVLRVRGKRGSKISLDVSVVDDPEYPLLSKYEMILESDLSPVQISDLKREEIDGFFRDVRSSWRPFAAGLPYLGSTDAPSTLLNELKAMEREKADSLPVKYIMANKGSGATTLLRAICWSAAQEGFPVLIARDAPFDPDAETVAAYVGRVNNLIQNITDTKVLFELPWVIAFDKGVWEGHEDALTVFVKKLEALGRQVLVLVVVGPFLPISFYKTRRYQELASLDHILESATAEDLGRHVNQYLEPIGVAKSLDQWRHFLRGSTQHSDGSKSSFWVTLSFWLQGRLEMAETFDTWVYRQFKEEVSDPDLVEAVLDIATLAAERVALPQALLPATQDYPVSHKLSDVQPAAPAIGLMSLTRNLEKFWTILHQSVAEALITQFYYDGELRTKQGFCDASSPMHLRLLLLRKIASDDRLGQKHFQVLAERFATHILKIDPAAGHARFVSHWRDALNVLDQMPDTFRKTNRVLLHHSSISRRRIANDIDRFPISNCERAQLLERAIQDINMALSIPAENSNEPDLNLLNSLARAYYDLAEVQIALGATPEAVRQSQRNAADATARAFRLNPDNSYVTETFAKNLLVEGRNNPEDLARNSLEVLTLVYSVLERDDSYERRRALTRLADEAFDLLLTGASSNSQADQPADAIEAIKLALYPLGSYEDRFEGMELTDYPEQLRMAAAERLADPILRSNPQAVKFRYILTCIDKPRDFALQLELLTSLGDAEGIVTPQMQLENAILLYQNGRYHEGDRMFQRLRGLWKQRVAFVTVPDRLHWLIDPVSGKRRQVRATVRTVGDFRNFADVEEFEGEQVPFRPREFQGIAERPRQTFTANVTFGHNGALLRPLTAS